MSNIEITDVNEALALLTRAVAEKGTDYKDPNAGGGVGCAYFEGPGRPGCIIGHVLSYKGLTIEATDAANHPTVYGGSWNRGTGVGEIPSDVLSLSRDVERVFVVAQESQDTGHTWGEALAEAMVEAQHAAAA